MGLAKYYSDAISDNVKRALEQKLRRGEWPAKAHYGYQNITDAQDKAEIIVDEFTSKVVQKAYSLYATGAYSMELLCKKLTQSMILNGLKGIWIMFLSSNSTVV